MPNIPIKNDDGVSGRHRHQRIIAQDKTLKSLLLTILIAGCSCQFLLFSFNELQQGVTLFSTPSRILPKSETTLTTVVPILPEPVVSSSLLEQSSAVTLPTLTEVPNPPTPNTSGAFLEIPSTEKTPTIVIHNDEDDDFSESDTIRFIDAKGHTYDMIVMQGKTVSRQLAVGNYEYSIITKVRSGKSVVGETGDATFRKYKRYEIGIVTVQSPFSHGYTHIGDD